MAAMLALVGNLSLGETLMIAVLAVLVFGRRLPEVAGQAYGQFRKLRRSLDDMRRETGIDREIRSLQRPLESAARAASVEDDAREPRRTAPAPPPSEPETGPETGPGGPPDTTSGKT